MTITAVLAGVSDDVVLVTAVAIIPPVGKLLLLALELLPACEDAPPAVALILEDAARLLDNSALLFAEEMVPEVVARLLDDSALPFAEETVPEVVVFVEAPTMY